MSGLGWCRDLTNGCASHRDARGRPDGLGLRAMTLARTVTSAWKVAASRAQASSKRSLWSQARGVNTAWAPAELQRMPLSLNRWVTTVLHAASTTPEPIGKP